MSTTLRPVISSAACVVPLRPGVRAIEDPGRWPGRAGGHRKAPRSWTASRWRPALADGHVLAVATVRPLGDGALRARLATSACAPVLEQRCELAIGAFTDLVEVVQSRGAES